MFSCRKDSSTPQYAPLALHEDCEDSSATLEKRSSSEDDQAAPFLEPLDSLAALVLSESYQLPKLI